MFGREAKNLKPFRGIFSPTSKGTTGALKYYRNSAVQEPIACRCTVKCNCDIAAQRAGPASLSVLDFVS